MIFLFFSLSSSLIFLNHPKKANYDEQQISNSEGSEFDSQILMTEFFQGLFPQFTLIEQSPKTLTEEEFYSEVEIEDFIDIYDEVDQNDLVS